MDGSACVYVCNGQIAHVSIDVRQYEISGAEVQACLDADGSLSRLRVATTHQLPKSRRCRWSRYAEDNCLQTRPCFTTPDLQLLIRVRSGDGEPPESVTEYAKTDNVSTPYT